MCTLSIFVSCLCWAWVRNIGKALWKIVSQCSQALCSFWNTNLYIFPHNLAHNWHCTQPETGIIGYFHVSLHEAAIRVRTAGHWLSLFCSLEVQGGITLITFPRPIPGWAELCWACSDCATPLAHWNAHKHTEHPQGPQSLHLVIAAFQENHPKVWKQIFISSASNTPLRACVGVQPQTLSLLLAWFLGVLGASPFLPCLEFYWGQLCNEELASRFENGNKDGVG